jgi:outer membrane protein TolC
VLSLDEAVRLALTRNPDLATARTQRGIAAAGVVIARTYPFNPIWQSFVMGASGPSQADISNRVFNEHVFRLDLEVRGQGRHRRDAAQAALSRTEWEIAFQEMTVGVRAARAFDALLYRREKLRLLEEIIRLQEQTAAQVERLFEQGKVTRADVMLARSDLLEGRALRGSYQAALVAAGNELRRVLDIEGEAVEVQGTLETFLPPLDAVALTDAALHNRPDLHARELAVREAEARERLEVANRFGNPSIGPAYEYNETRINFIGAWFYWQLPVFNTRRGEILQRQAERERALADQRRVEVLVRQDVQTALARLAEAREWVAAFRGQALPQLREILEAFDRLFASGEPGVDVPRLVEARRRVLRAREGYLDALWELSQARADLAAAVGDLTVVTLPPPAELPCLPRAVLGPPQ